MRTLPALTTAAVLLTAAALPAWAASSASSASSEGSSASVGSSSTSIEKSSASSSKGDKVAEGPYRVITVADAPAQPGRVRVLLQAQHDEAERFVLTLPAEAAQKGRVAPGAVVLARHQPYGLQFAAADTREPFFLVVGEDWQRGLRTQPVTL